MDPTPKPQSDKKQAALRRVLLITLVMMPFALVLLAIGLAVQVDRGTPVSVGQIALVVFGIVYAVLAALWLWKERRDRGRPESRSDEG